MYEVSGGAPIAQFEIQDQEGKKHKSPPIAGFVEGSFVGKYKVLCNELLTGEVLEDFFHFYVDFTPPLTQVILSENDRELKPVSSNWEEFFIRSASIDFDCDLDDEGFACDKTFYCLGDGCELLNDDKYREYEGTLAINQSSNICYYSVDTGNSRVFSPQCGKITVDGYGIKLEHPEKYTYQDEVWGISNEILFDLKFSTRIPTVECRVDFTSDFSYEDVETYKIKEPNAEKKYVFSNFPESVFTDFSSRGSVKALYVKCMDGSGEISPEQKFNLEYDPSNPEINEAKADPDPVLEGRQTFIKINTDDKTLCRYSDNSDGICIAWI